MDKGCASFPARDDSYHQKMSVIISAVSSLITRHLLSRSCDSAVTCVSGSSYLRFLRLRCEITSICWAAVRFKAASQLAESLVRVDLTSPGCRENSGPDVVNFFMHVLGLKQSKYFSRAEYQMKGASPPPPHPPLPFAHFARGSVK